MNRAIDDVIGRFLVNLPTDEPPSVDRLFHHIVQARWFYEDFYVDDDESGGIPHLRFSEFTAQVFDRCPLLAGYNAKHRTYYEEFKAYVARIPVCGAILLNRDMDKIALAQNWSGKSWVFPKGKINQGEQPHECAIREVLEETGFNCKGLLTKKTPFLQVKSGDKAARFYVVRGVPEDTHFEPQTRKEIRSVQFFHVTELPFFKGTPKPQRFWNIRSTLHQLRQHIEGVTKRPIPRATKRTRGRGSRDSDGRALPSMASSGLPGMDRTGGEDEDTATFGDGSGDGYSVDAMLRANERLTGQSFAYDGNPHTFGMEHDSRAGSAAARSDTPTGASKSGSRHQRRQQSKQRRRKLHQGRDRGGRMTDDYAGGTQTEGQNWMAGLGASDTATFGDGSGDGYSVDAMLRANERLTGQSFAYDGNPHTFGMEHDSRAGSAAARSGPPSSSSSPLGIPQSESKAAQCFFDVGLVLAAYDAVVSASVNKSLGIASVG